MNGGKIGAINWANIRPDDLDSVLKLDPMDFDKETGQSKPRKNDFIILYCMKGVRSAIAAEQFEAQGYTNVHDYKGMDKIL